MARMLCRGTAAVSSLSDEFTFQRVLGTALYTKTTKFDISIPMSLRVSCLSRAQSHVMIRTPVYNPRGQRSCFHKWQVPFSTPPNSIATYCWCYYEGTPHFFWKPQVVQGVVFSDASGFTALTEKLAKKSNGRELSKLNLAAGLVNFLNVLSTSCATAALRKRFKPRALI